MNGRLSVDSQLQKFLDHTRHHLREDRCKAGSDVAVIEPRNGDYITYHAFCREICHDHSYTRLLSAGPQNVYPTITVSFQALLGVRYPRSPAAGKAFVLLVNGKIRHKSGPRNAALVSRSRRTSIVDSNSVCHKSSSVTRRIPSIRMSN